MEIPVDLDKDIVYEGNTEEEVRLNKELLGTILELNSYQVAYDKMLTVEQVKSEVEKLENILREEYIPDNDKFTLKGSLQALKWVLNGSETQEEKLARLPKASREEVAKIIKGFNDNYKQLTIYDFGVDEDE